MPIPKIETPEYTLTLPSNGQEVKFRPFLVKEEKILLLAQESKDTRNIADAMIKIIDNCTFGELDAKKLSNLDFQYVFLQLRIRSVGETSEFIIKCEHCGHDNNVIVDLRTAEIVQPEKEIDPIVKVTDNVGINLRPASLLQYAATISVDNNVADNINDMVKGVVESIYEGDTIYPIDEISDKEFMEFVDSLTHGQLEHISSYIDNEPQLVIKVSFNCESCGEKNETVVKGSQSFFM